MATGMERGTNSTDNGKRRRDEDGGLQGSDTDAVIV